MNDDIFIMIVVVSAIWAFVGIVHRIVDGVVKTKQARIELEREYLASMMRDLDEIKQRLDALSAESSFTP